jgi:hypothetical protein
MRIAAYADNNTRSHRESQMDNSRITETGDSDLKFARL